ncbi:hypothetical protein BDFB_010958 [Asbolus verrucosus]|uniref:Saccharopine dehydrogenase-like C-terminal domain-containing protein n=1 Tax=Asbolus verrucosus TaxID=1661398 RepID=A0A482WA48_ASBVE|nr:hypothetical protein BDFB_010958 [Asbolus verrucosus]
MVESFTSVKIFTIFGSIFSLLANMQFGRSLLLKYPEQFSYGLVTHEPPSEEKLAKTWFSVTFYGEGWKEELANADDQYSIPVNRAIVTRVKGRNPAYGSTCTCLVLAAITVITETNKLPSTGGVYTPGYAFANTSLIKELDENGVTFEVLSEKDLPLVSKY